MTYFLGENMPKNCKLVWKGKKPKKLYCKTHRQSLMYVYDLNGTVGYRCQVGEDEHSPPQMDTEE